MKTAGKNYIHEPAEEGLGHHKRFSKPNPEWWTSKIEKLGLKKGCKIDSILRMKKIEGSTCIGIGKLKNK